MIKTQKSDSLIEWIAYFTTKAAANRLNFTDNYDVTTGKETRQLPNKICEKH